MKIWKEPWNGSWLILFRISICIPITIRSLIFHGTACSKDDELQGAWQVQDYALAHVNWSEDLAKLSMGAHTYIHTHAHKQTGQTYLYPNTHMRTNIHTHANMLSLTQHTHTHTHAHKASNTHTPTHTHTRTHTHTHVHAHTYTHTNTRAWVRVNRWVFSLYHLHLTGLWQRRDRGDQYCKWPPLIHWAVIFLHHLNLGFWGVMNEGTVR